MLATNRHKPSTIAFFLTLATLFLLAHPYTGVRHDAILYSVQAFYNTHPADFTHDLFFAFGSQDNWTIYGKLFARIIAEFGFRASNLGGLIVAQALWWSGMWRLARRLLPTPWHWLCLFFVACLPGEYGAASIFSYDEFFLTARLPAEALGLWAVALMLERRHIIALALTVIASALHPLIGGVTLAIVLLDLMPRVKFWRLLPFALIAFAIIELPPFKALHLYPFDPEWREISQLNLPHLFPTKWNLNAWSKACWAIALPAALCAKGRSENRALWSNLTFVGVAGIALCTVADLTGQDAAWTQLQTWRTLWLLTLMQWPAAIQLVRDEARVRPMLVWLLTIGWLLLDVGGGIFALLIAASLHVFAHRERTGTPSSAFGEITPLSRLALVGTTLLALAIWFTYQLAYQYGRVMHPTGSVPFDVKWLEALIHTRLVILLIGLLALLVHARQRFAVAGLPIALSMLAAYSLVNIDQRSDSAKIMEALTDRPDLAPFKDIVACGKMVYWDGRPEEIVYPWLLMKTSSYYSPTQASGMIFHRQTTFEAVKRYERITQDPYADRRPHAGDTGHEGKIFIPNQTYVPLTEIRLMQICADPTLDFVVSPSDYANLSTHRTWSPGRDVRYWLYDCRHIRTASRNPAVSSASLQWANTPRDDRPQSSQGSPGANTRQIRGI